MIQRRFTTLALFVGLGTGVAGPAAAQNAESAAAADEVQEVVVSGIRSSLQSSAEQKRNASQIVDAVTAEDIGKFPTENVADATQRITGVQITRTRGEGTAVSIRGLPPDFTRVQLNGSTLSSATVDLRGGGSGGNISRSFDFRLLPTEFVSTLEVVKSPTADMQEGGLAGTIDVKTVRPLQLGESRMVGSAFAARDSNSGEVTPRVSALLSRTFMDGRLGALVAGGFSKDMPETHGLNNIGWTTQPEATNDVDYNGDGDQTDVFNVPSQIRTEIAREDRKRTAFAGVVELKATDSLNLFAEGFYSRFDVYVESLENLFIFTGATGGVFDPSTTQLQSIPGIATGQLAAGKDFATSLGLTGTDARGNDRINDSVSDTVAAKIGADFRSGKWDGHGSLSLADSRLTGDNLNLAQIQRFQAAYNCQPGQEICGLTLSPESQARYLDPNQGIVASLNGAFGRETKDRVTELRLDVHRDLDNSIFSRVSFGGVGSQRETFANGRVLVATAAQIASAAGLSPSTVQNGLSVVPYTQLVSAGSGRFLGSYNGSLPFPQQWLATDTQAIIDALGRDRLSTLGTIQDNLNTVVDVEEKIVALYGRANFSSADARLTGNFGIRVVRTQADSQGVAPDLTGLRILVDAGGTVSVPPAGAITAAKSYTEILPSFNIRYDLTDDMLLRLAASRTMSRPSLVQISPSTTIAGGAGNYTITTGNPDLDPFIATNFDVSVEWYANPDTTLTFALFQKDLSTLTRPAVDSVTLPVTFVTASTNTTEVRQQLFQRTRPINQRGVTLKGFEVGYQQAFAFLPGFLRHTGVQMNYTFISNSDEEVLTAASKNNYNLGLFFETPRFGVRTAYTWRDEFVSGGLPDAYNGLGTQIQPRGTLDINLNVNVSDWLSVIVEGTNLLDNVDAARSTLGDLPVDYFDPGRTLMAGFRLKF